MKDLFDLIKGIFEIFQSLWDFIAGAFRGAVQCAQAAISFLGILDEVIGNMPTIVIPFMFATVGFVILYFVIGLVTGGES